MRIAFLLLLFFAGQPLRAQVADTLWNRGVACFKEENFHGTISYMDTLLRLNPGLGDAYYNRGIAKMNLGNLEASCSDLKMAELSGSNISKEYIEYQCNPEFMRQLMVKMFYKNTTVIPELGYRPRYTRADTLRGALRPERTCFDVHFYDLYVGIFPRGKKIKARTGIYFEVKQPTRTIQIDLFDNFKINSISWNQIPLTWRWEYNAVFIDFPEQLETGEFHNIEISYQGKPLIAPNPPWDGGFVWEQDINKDLWLGVACEQLGASSWWPNKDHLSDKPDSVRIQLEIPSGYQAVSNGDLINTRTISKKRDCFTWFVEYPINNYNVTFYVGKYVSFGDTLIHDNDTLRMDYYVLAHNLDTAREHFKQVREVLQFYNKAYGFYPFARDGFGLVESPYEGMEHQSAIAYGHGYKNNSMQDYRNRFYDYIIVHEAAHEWWGNSVTAKDMADVWIHEGFATYAEFMFIEDRLGMDDYYYELTDKSRYIFNVWPMVQNRDVNEDAFASNDVYNKGAMMLHCLRCIINNDSLFFGLIRDFCILNQYQTVTSNDFITFVNRYTGSDHTAFFNKFLLDTQIPVLEYSYTLDGNDLVIKYRWSGVEDGFKMPFGIGTSNKEALRIMAGSSWQEIQIPGASWFNFFNLWKGYAGCADNSYTYYHTRLL